MCGRLLGVWERHIAWKPPRLHSHDDEGTRRGRCGDVRGTAAGNRGGDRLGNWNHQDLTPWRILFLNWSRVSPFCVTSFSHGVVDFKMLLLYRLMVVASFVRELDNGVGGCATMMDDFTRKKKRRRYHISHKKLISCYERVNYNCDRRRIQSTLASSGWRSGPHGWVSVSFLIVTVCREFNELAGARPSSSLKAYELICLLLVIYGLIRFLFIHWICT